MQGDPAPVRLSSARKASSVPLTALPPRNSLSEQPPPASRLVNHGTSLQGKIVPSPQSAVSSLLFKSPQELWVLDTNAARLWTGWPLTPDDSVKRLTPLSTKTAVHAHFPQARPECVVLPEQKCVLVWARGHPTVCLFDFNLVLLSTSTIPPPQCLVYNPSTNEVLVCDDTGKILAYIADNTRGLHLRNTLTPTLPAPDHGPVFIHALSMDDNETHHQRLFGACGRAVSVCEMSGKHVSLVSPAHNAKVTTLLYLSHAETLLTASEDGSIKIWDALLQVIHLFVAHTGPVSTLLSYPLHPHMFISASLDTTVRVWSTQTYDTTLTIPTQSPVLSVAFLPEPHTALLAVISEESVSFININHVYRPYAVLDRQVWVSDGLSARACVQVCVCVCVCV
jgi:WD40 repeat protein